MDPSGIKLTLLVHPYNSDVHFMNWLVHIWRNRSWYNKIFYNPIEKILVELSGVLEIRLFSKIINITQFILLSYAVTYNHNYLCNKVSNKFFKTMMYIGSNNAQDIGLILDGFHLPQIGIKEVQMLQE